MGLIENEVRARVDEALEQVSMSNYRDRLSHHLSVGEKKRIAIATVLAMRPQILLLDEPSSGLDPRARRSLINLLRDMSITMLVSTHDLRMVSELFTRMVIMDEGCIVADGSTNALMEDRQLLYLHGLEMPTM
jgi:cobalt/nickel transport system ATP-binding protein